MADNEAILPYEQMLRDAAQVLKIMESDEGSNFIPLDQASDLACHVLALVQEIKKADAEINRLREFEWMYKELCK